MTEIGRTSKPESLTKGGITHNASSSAGWKSIRIAFIFLKWRDIRIVDMNELYAISHKMPQEV